MSNKVLIIGATSAIAQSVAHRLAAQGAALFLTGRSSEKLELIASDLRIRHGATVGLEAIDFDDFSQHAPLIARATGFLHGLDAAIICHGSLPDQTACERDFSLAEAAFRSTFLSPASFLTHLANDFEKRGAGILVAISSVAGDRGRQSNYIYGTAKAALSIYLQGLRNRLTSKGVHVLTVKPGFVDTPMTAHLRKGLLFATPEKVARDIVRAMEKRHCELYTPWFWSWIMRVIQSIPEPIFRRLRL